MWPQMWQCLTGRGDSAWEKVQILVTLLNETENSNFNIVPLVSQSEVS
jgi:hypothetical protein